MMFIRFLFICTFLGSILWGYFSPGFESILAILTSLSAIIGNFFYASYKDADRNKQTISDGSFGIQAGRDVNVSNVSLNSKNKSDV